MYIQYISLNKILPSQFHLRKKETSNDLKSLIKSISNMGILQPIILRSMNGFYEIISGTRRFEVAKILGMQKIPAVIIKVTDVESMQIFLADNIQRRNLNFIEEADLFQHLMVYYGCDKQEISDKIGEDEFFVTKRLNTLSLNNNAKKIIYDNNISIDDATKISKLKDKTQIDVLNNINNTTENVILKATLSDTINSIPFESDIRTFSNVIKDAVNKVKDYGFKTSCIIMKSHNCCNINIKISI